MTIRIWGSDSPQDEPREWTFWDEVADMTFEEWEALLRRSKMATPLRGYVVLRRDGGNGKLYMYDGYRMPFGLDRTDADRAAREAAAKSPGTEIYVAKLVSVSVTHEPVTTTDL